MDAGESSQIVSGLLLAAARFDEGIDLSLSGGVPSLPHVEMTVTTLREHGVDVTATDRGWRVTPGPIAAVDRIIEPDLSMLIDVDLNTSARRIDARGKSRERFEIESFLAGVRARYLAIFDDPDAGIGQRVVIDGTRDKETVAYDVVGAVMKVLSEDTATRSADE